MFYNVDGHRYLLVPQLAEPLQKSPGGRPKLAGARLYIKKRYIGFWHVENIPLGVVRQLQQEVASWRAEP